MILIYKSGVIKMLKMLKLILNRLGLIFVWLFSIFIIAFFLSRPNIEVTDIVCVIFIIFGQISLISDYKELWRKP
jgi:phosphatidylglycerophosphate synthase